MRRITAQGAMLVGARVISSLFRPNHYPVVAFFVLLNFTFMAMLPLLFRVYVLIGVYILTYLLPTLAVMLYRKVRRLTAQQLTTRHERIVPYVINIICHLACMHFVWKLRLPSFLLAVVAICVCLQCLCTLITLRWKISLHTAACGSGIGALLVYSQLFDFNPVWWLCLMVIINGLLGSSRMLLRQHTLWQVVGGTWVGVACGLLGIMLI